jgi:hypothetical protein
VQHCVDGADCSDPACFDMHPCPGFNCHHYGKTWLEAKHFKYSSSKRFKTCNDGRLQVRPRNSKFGAQATERKRKQRVEHELATYPELDLSAQAMAGAGASASAAFDAALYRARKRYIDRLLSVNVYGASTGSEGYSIEQEGEKSTLTERGYSTPAIVAPCSGRTRGWRALNGSERRDLGPPGEQIYDAGHSKETSKHVELHVQRHAKQQRGLQQLWRVDGQGGPKGLPPYCVGVRFIPHDEDGSLPHGFYHT